MKNFNWDEFKTGDIVVHCDTEKKANDFLKQAHEHELAWAGEESLLEDNRYDRFKEDTCYRAQFSTRMVFSDIVYYKDDNYYEIIEWEIDNVKEFTVKDLKVGMLVKTKQYDKLGYGMVMPSKSNGIIIIYKNETWGDINFLSITEVWGYSYCSYAALRFSPADRELLYKREEPKKMTVKEICELVGFDVEIVKE